AGDPKLMCDRVDKSGSVLEIDRRRWKTSWKKRAQGLAEVRFARRRGRGAIARQHSPIDDHRVSSDDIDVLERPDIERAAHRGPDSRVGQYRMQARQARAQNVRERDRKSTR